MEKVVLPEFGSHLSKRARLYKFNELLAAPFPKAETTEEVLSIAAQVEEQGYLIVVRAQRPVRLRAPKEGERGIVVAETTDQPASYKPTSYYFTPANAATGKPNSKLWFCSRDYPFLGSFKALQEAWRERREQLRLNELVRAGLLGEE